ncbi:MAG: pentapeptide repeat-containing protein, partial [Actinomycetes bacterium]
MKRALLSLLSVVVMLVSSPAIAAAKVTEPNPCTQAPVAGSAQSYHGCNFVKLGAGAPSFAGQNLSGFDFTLANMQNLDLHGANLSGANLSHANLSGANLENVFVTGSTQENDLLSHVNFGKADLKNADFREVITSSRISQVRISRISISPTPTSTTRCWLLRSLLEFSSRES